MMQRRTELEILNLEKWCSYLCWIEQVTHELLCDGKFQFL